MYWLLSGGDGSLNIAYELFKMGCQLLAFQRLSTTISRQRMLLLDLTLPWKQPQRRWIDCTPRPKATTGSAVVEVMGRYVGWIALETGIGGGADVILIPEIPFDISKVCPRLSTVKSGSKASIVVVSEGAKPIGGEVTILYVHRMWAGALNVLAVLETRVGADIGKCTEIEVRVTVLDIAAGRFPLCSTVSSQPVWCCGS